MSAGFPGALCLQQRSRLMINQAEYPAGLGLCPHLNDGGIIPGADEIAGVALHQLAEGGLVALLHGLPQLGRQVLRARALEAVGSLPVDGVHLHVVWCLGHRQGVSDCDCCLRLVRPLRWLAHLSPGPGRV